MKTLSANTQTAFDNPHVSPVRLLTIVLSGVTLRLCDRVFGEPGSECVFDGNIYEPLVLEWHTIERGRLNPPAFDTEPAAAQVTVDNTTPVGGYDTLAALLADKTAPYATATVTETYDGASAAADGVTVFAGDLEDVTDMTAPELVLTFTGVEVSLKKTFARETVNETDFANAAPAVIGRMLPVVYGSARQVPFLPIDVGVVTTLRDAIAAGDDSDIVLSDDISAMGASGTIQIGEEKITYTGKTDATKTLTGITRGANSTQSTDHAAGSVVGEVKSEYVYALGCAAKAVDAVYVAGVLQDSGEYTVYTGVDGDDHATYPNRCVIVFTALSVIRQAVTGSVDYGIARPATNTPAGYITAVDKNGVVAGYDETTTITFPSAPSGTLSDIYVEYEFEITFHWLPGVSSWDMTNMPDAGFDFFVDGVLVANLGPDAATGTTPVLSEYKTGTLRVSKSTWPTSATKSKTFRHMDFGTVSIVVSRAVVHATSTVEEANQWGTQVSRAATNLPAGRIESRAAVDDTDEITFPAAPAGNLSGIYIALTWTFTRQGEAITSDKPRTYDIDDIPVCHVAVDADHGLSDAAATILLPQTLYLPQTSWQTAIDKTPSRLAEWVRGEEFVVTDAEQFAWTDDADGVALAGVIDGVVSADVDGIVDDGSGTITGTPYALIERPDHICEHIITEKCGLAAAAVNSTAYAAAGAEYASASYVLGLAILQPPDVRLLLHRIARQCNSIECWEGGAHMLKYVPDSGETAVKTIIADRIDLDQLWVRYTDRADIVNDLTATYDYAWAGGNPDDSDGDSTVSADDSASDTKYGTLSEKTSYPYITGETQAQAVVDREIDNRADLRLLIELAGGYWMSDIERGDVINFSFDADDELDQALLGLVTSETDLFRVIDMIDRPDAAKQIQVIKIG